MLTEIGIVMVSISATGGGFPIVKSWVEKGNHKAKLHKSFVDGGLSKTMGKNQIYPKTLRVDPKEKKITFVFNIPKGMNPEEFIKKEYVFKQHFGQYINLNINEKRGVLQVYPSGLPAKFNYDYDVIIEAIQDIKLPVVCGQSLEGDVYAFDLVEHPHILISGETGSGKSSEIRSILTTLIQTMSPKELRLVLGDLKRSEFHLFKQIEHVDSVCHSAMEIKPHLKKVKKEMTKRGNKLDEEEVNSIDELKEKLPYIVVCIDEVVLLKKERDIMDILEEISSIGRSLGIFLILSMQRPDAKLLDGALKINLTVRMGFQTADAINSKIIGTPGAEKLTNPGRMILKINSSYQEIQCPWLKNDKAKLLLTPYKIKEIESPIEDESPEQNKRAKVLELFKNEET